MRLALIPHPDTPPGAVRRIDVEAERDGRRLSLRYRVSGRIAGLLLPLSGASRRAAGLWRHTCLEAFVGLEGGYVELNLAPSRAWAAYRFDGYRSGMADFDLPPPRIEGEKSEDGYRLSAQIEGLPEGHWTLGVAAVIEEVDGRLSYWALRHPPGKPDFHHPDCFVLGLSPPPAP